jgi:hypothetical protein
LSRQGKKSSKKHTELGDKKLHLLNNNNNNSSSPHQQQFTKHKKEENSKMDAKKKKAHKWVQCRQTKLEE